MRTFLRHGFVVLLSASLAAAWLSCGETPPPETPKPPPAPTVAPTAAPTAEPTATAGPEPPPADTAAADAGPPKKTSSGRPPILKSSESEITDTFGSTPAARLEIGDKDIATLRIPEGAFERATNVTFKLDTKGKGGGAQVGKIFRITIFIPPGNEPRKVASAADPFELRLPAGSKKDANLAIGEIGADPKTGREKITWRVLAPVKIDDASGVAYYELPDLGGDMYLHVTTKAPAEPK